MPHHGSRWPVAELRCWAVPELGLNLYFLTQWHQALQMVLVSRSAVFKSEKKKKMGKTHDYIKNVKTSPKM